MIELVQIYKKRNFAIYSNLSDGYVVHNRRKEFSIGHTHINNFNTAKYLIYASTKKIIPNHFSKYLVESLIRLSDDSKYTRRLEEYKKRYSKD